MDKTEPNARDNYQLVILGANWDLYKIAYSDITNKSNYICWVQPEQYILKTLFKIHFSPRLNTLHKLPFKSIWLKYFFRNIKPNQKYIFLIFRTWWQLDEDLNLVSFLRRNYPQCKIILFLQDILSSYNLSCPQSDLPKIFNRFDLVISYDKSDSNKYSLYHHNTVLSDLSKFSNTSISYDVFFIGKDKGRLQEIIQIYDQLSDLGLRCKFILLNVDSKQRVFPDKIEYIDKTLPYETVLELSSKSKCLLEVLQPHATGITYRTLEAISLNKLLLTNNTAIKESGLYDDKYVTIFSKPGDITEHFVSTLNTRPFEKNPYKDIISPKRLVSDIEQKLGIKISF